MRKREYISRQLYIDKIKPYIGTDIIKVFIGQRRVGKSFMLYQVMDMVEQIDDGQIIYINKELHDFSAIKDHKDLIQHVESVENGGAKKKLFIDEIQEIECFETALMHFQATGDYDIYCTGSNAHLLSSELATKIAGRYVEIDIFSLCYSEFLQFHSLADDEESFYKYIKYGGLPYLRNLVLDDDVVFDYLRNIADAIILKDVVARHALRNVEFLKRLILFIGNHIGSIISAKKISDFLKSQEVNISPKVVLNYLDHLVEACLIFKVLRTDMVGKKVFEIGEKYYLQDLGLRHALVGYRQPDINKVLENTVFQHLKIAGYDVKVGVLGDKEIDFVCSKSGEKIYIQVAYLLPDEKVCAREFGNLMNIPDNYPKYVLSMDQSFGGTYEGVQHVNIREFIKTIIIQ